MSAAQREMMKIAIGEKEIDLDLSRGANVCVGIATGGALIQTVAGEAQRDLDIAVCGIIGMSAGLSALPGQPGFDEYQRIKPGTRLVFLHGGEEYVAPKTAPDGTVKGFPRINFRNVIMLWDLCKSGDSDVPTWIKDATPNNIINKRETIPGAGGATGTGTGSKGVENF